MEYQYLIDTTKNEITNICIRRLTDNVVIPNNPENIDWQQYQAWLAAGNTPLPPA